MLFGTVLFSILSAVADVAWFLESPAVAYHGMRHAQCRMPTLGCIRAGREVLQVQRQNRLAELEQKRHREIEAVQHRQKESGEQEGKFRKADLLDKLKAEDFTLYATYVDNSVTTMLFNQFDLLDAPIPDVDASSSPGQKRLSPDNDAGLPNSVHVKVTIHVKAKESFTTRLSKWISNIEDQTDIVRPAWDARTKSHILQALGWSIVVYATCKVLSAIYGHVFNGANQKHEAPASITSSKISQRVQSQGTPAARDDCDAVDALMRAARARREQTAIRVREATKKLRAQYLADIEDADAETEDASDDPLTTARAPQIGPQ